MSDELQMVWRKESWPDFPEGSEESQDSRCPGPDSNRAPPKYKSRALSLEQSVQSDALYSTTYFNVSEVIATSIINVEDGGGMFSRNNSKYLPDYTMSILLFADVGTTKLYYCLLQEPKRKVSKITIDRRAGAPPSPTLRRHAGCF
jgi:hypothetical protein